MKVGFQFQNTLPWKSIVEIVQAADRLKYSSVWNYDHLVPPHGALASHLEHPDGENGAVLEASTMLAALAPLTLRIRLGTLVNANSLRNPALLAKMAATMDVISNGRFELGLGASWHEREHKAYGFHYPSPGERSERLEEAAHLIRLLLGAQGPVTFEGRHYQLDAAPFSPKSMQQPRLPLMIGGGGEMKTLRTVALWADTANLFANMVGTIDDLKHKLDVLRAYCAEVGRDPSEIRITVSSFVILEPDESRAIRLRQRYGQHLPPEQRDLLPFGGVRRIVDHPGSLAELDVDEVLMLAPFALGQPLEDMIGHVTGVEYLERFDRDVISELTGPAPALALTG